MSNCGQSRPQSFVGPLCTQRTSRATLLPSPSAAAIENKVTDSMAIDPSNYLTCHRKKELTAQPYYHSNLRSKEEVKRFMSKAEPGEFLLRNSFSETASYTFSLMHKTGVKHIKLDCRDGLSYSLKDRQFPSIEQLVLYYSRQAIPNSDNLPDVFLSRAILRKNPIQAPGGDDSWTYLHPIPTSTRTNQTPDEPRHHYDTIRDEDASVTEEVLRGLEAMDRSCREFCDCGLVMDEAELPRGWSVHLSQDPETRGRVYFMSPDGDPLWDLPLHVCLDLTLDQQDLIRRLMHDADLRGRSASCMREDAEQGRWYPPDGTLSCFRDDARGGGAAAAGGTAGGGAGGARGAGGAGGGTGGGGTGGTAGGAGGGAGGARGATAGGGYVRSLPPTPTVHLTSSSVERKTRDVTSRH